MKVTLKSLKRIHFRNWHMRHMMLHSVSVNEILSIICHFRFNLGPVAYYLIFYLYVAVVNTINVSLNKIIVCYLYVLFSNHFLKRLTNVNTVMIYITTSIYL